MVLLHSCKNKGERIYIQILIHFMCQNRRFSGMNHVVLVQLIPIPAVTKVIARCCYCLHLQDVAANRIPHLCNYAAKSGTQRSPKP